MIKSEFIIIPIIDPWSFRFVNSNGLLEYFKDTNYRVLIITNDNYLEHLPKHTNIHLYCFKVSKVGFPFFRLLNIVHRLYGNHSYSKFFQSRMNVFVSYLAWLVKFPILLRFIGYISDKIIGFIPCELDTVIESNHFIYLDLSPYNYISHSFAKRLSYRDNAKIIYVLPSWDNLYKWHTHLFYDKYLVWGDSQKDFFKKLQIHPCKLETFGGPNVWNLFNKIISAPRTTKILYTSVSEKLFPGEKDFILQLIGMIQKNLFGDDVKLLVRLHPYDFSEISDFPIDDRIEIKRSNYSKDTLNWVVPNYFYLDLINDLENCKLVICMASSITLDAVLYGRIVLNIQDDNLENDYYSFNHYTPISTSGTIPIVKISDNELLQQEINNFISMDIHQYEAEVNNQRVGVSKVVDFEKDKTFFFELIKNLN